MDPAGWAKILIVADEPASPPFLEALLRDAGYVHIRNTTDLRAVLTLVAELQPDLLCLDLVTPHGADVRLVEDLRQQRPAHTYLPILVLAGEAPPETRRRILAAGANDFLTRPVDRVELLLRARNLLETRRLHRVLQTERASLDAVVHERTAQLVEAAAEQEQIQRRAEASEVFLRAMFDAAPDPVLITNRHGEIVRLNALVERLSGYSRHELIGQPIDGLIAEDQRAAYVAGRRAFVDTAAPDETRPARELTVLGKDGTRLPVEVVLSVVDVADERYVIAIARDITERQRAEARMRLQSAALEAAADAILIADREGTIQWVNLAFSTLTGYAAEEVVGRRPRLLRSGQHPPAFYEHLWRTILSGAVWRGEVVNQYKDGRLATEAMTITPVRGDDGAITHFIAIKQDVTAAKDAERSQARLAAILEASPDFVATADPRGRVLYLNRAARQLLELPDDLDPSLVTIAGTHPPWAADLVLREGIPTALRDGVWQGETAFLSRSGQLIPVLQIILAHKASDGRIEFLSTIARDISERKRSEDEAQRQHTLAVQNEKLAAMSTLLAGVAHELNNPLAVVVGRAALLRAKVHDEALARQTGQLEEAAVRCARIVKNFLALARQEPPERAPSALNGIVRDAVDILAYPLRVDGVELRLELAEDLPQLQADAHQLGQVIINLVSNAHHAVRGAETRRIIVTTRHEAAPGFVSLTVEDTGPGIPPDIERRMFEPFFTTKPLGQGTGLGLPLCRGIVADHGGALRVDGRPGRGARFVVELPVQPAAGPASGPAPLGAPAPIPPCRILVVDDEPEVASLVAEVLVDDHHTVETVTSGRAALERLDARAYDVIVSDIRMPDLDGIAFCRVLEQHQPAAGARLIFLTGDTLDPALGEFLRRSGHPYVAKPFTPEQLRRALAQVLAPGLAGAREGLGAAPPPPSR